MIIAGIDPGFKGGVAFVDSESREAEVYKMPAILGKSKAINLKALKDLLTDKETQMVFIEEPQAIPKQGLVSTSRFFYWTGAILGLCAGLGIPVYQVRAKVWKKKFSLKAKDKAQSIILASELFPQITFGKNDDGQAEALLIAFYGFCFMNDSTKINSKR